MTIADDKLHRFTLEEYHQMADLGWFDEKRVELLEGQILEMSPQNEPHVNAVSSMFEFLREHLPKGLYRIRCQAPVRTGEQSEPEPDFAIVAAPSTPATGRDHPTTALLVIEISDTSLARDRRKAPLYASANIPEYWIVNLAGRILEQYTQPHEGDYRTRQVHTESGLVQCTSLPLPPFAVKDCLNIA